MNGLLAIHGRSGSGWWAQPDPTGEPLVATVSYTTSRDVTADEGEATVREPLTRVFETYGLPDAMITDNGNPWGQQNGPTRLTTLSV
jgi:hypothetical protein